MILERLEDRRLLDGGLVAGQAALLAEAEDERVPDFSLLDTNPTSPTYNQLISPRDYLGKVSAWYFGHAT